MKYCTRISAVVALLLITSCASVEQPKPDPVKEELATLQKQFLELQKLQNETKAKLEESNATVNSLSLKVQALEERQSVRVIKTAQIESNPTGTVPDKKTKPARKKTGKKTKKKARRQG